jgi:hypothetical protein
MEARKRSGLLRRLIFTLLLICAVSVTAAAQDISTAKREAIMTVMDAMKVRARTAKLFEQQVSTYAASWPDSVFADLKAKGLLKDLSPTDAAKLKNALREFAEKVFSEIKIRVVSQFGASDKLDLLMIDVYGRHFSDEELVSMAAFCKNPNGARVIDRFLPAFDNAYISALEAKGYARVLESPEAEMKKLKRMQKDFASGAPEILNTAARKVRSDLTADELREAQMFVASPAGLKLAKTWPNLVGDVYVTSNQTYGPQIIQLSQEVIKEHWPDLEQRVRETMKNSVGQQRRGPN